MAAVVLAKLHVLYVLFLYIGFRKVLFCNDFKVVGNCDFYRPSISPDETVYQSSCISEIVPFVYETLKNELSI